MNVHPFTPAFKSTQKITVVGTSTAATNLMNANDPCVRITNSGGNDCFVNISSIATTCDDTDLIVLSKTSIVVYKGSAQYLSAIHVSANTVLYFTTGNNGV